MSGAAKLFSIALVSIACYFLFGMFAQAIFPATYTINVSEVDRAQVQALKQSTSELDQSRRIGNVSFTVIPTTVSPGGKRVKIGYAKSAYGYSLSNEIVSSASAVGGIGDLSILRKPSPLAEHFAVLSSAGLFLLLSGNVILRRGVSSNRFVK